MNDEAENPFPALAKERFGSVMQLTTAWLLGRKAQIATDEVREALAAWGMGVTIETAVGLLTVTALVLEQLKRAQPDSEVESEQDEMPDVPPNAPRH